mmetsp:Transcript_5962/g.16188  ORF Transcript_5962/g.16188 Transcript_5962/m.16188 type:complete len:273 (-) Transcript_5962:25-843(-)
MEYLQSWHWWLWNVTCLGLDDLVDDTVLDGLLRGHEEIAVAVLLDLVLWLVAVIGNVRVQNLADEEDLLGLDLDVGGLSLGTSQRLVDHDAGVGKGSSLALGAGAQQEGSHAGGHTEADGGDVARDVLHGVVDGHTGGDGTTWGVDVEGDVLVRVLVGEVEELGDQDVGDLVIDALSQKEDSVLQQTADDIHLSLLGVNDWHADRWDVWALIWVLSAWVDLRCWLIRHHGPLRSDAAVHGGGARQGCGWAEGAGWGGEGRDGDENRELHGGC